MKLSIAHLRAAGLTDTQIVKAIEEADAERRERERIKKRNQRARPRDGGDGGDMHIDKKEQKEQKERKQRKKTIPDNWQLADREWRYAKDHGWDDKRIAREGERFKKYHQSKGTLFANVYAGWCNWVTSPYQEPQRNGGYHQSVKDRNREVMDELNEFIERAEDDERRGSTRGSQANQQLSFSEPDGAQGIPRRAGLRLVEIPGGSGDRGPGPGDASEPELPAAGTAGRTTLWRTRE